MKKLGNQKELLLSHIRNNGYLLIILLLGSCSSKNIKNDIKPKEKDNKLQASYFVHHNKVIYSIENLDDKPVYLLDEYNFEFIPSSIVFNGAFFFNYEITTKLSCYNFNGPEFIVVNGGDKYVDTIDIINNEKIKNKYLYIEVFSDKFNTVKPNYSRNGSRREQYKDFVKKNSFFVKMTLEQP